MTGVGLRTTQVPCVILYLALCRPHQIILTSVQGLSNFQNSQAFIGGFPAFAQTFVYAFYSFGGIELVAIAAGESAKPEKSIPRAIKATFFRIVLFYILAILTMGLCINYQDPTLLTAAFGMSSSSIGEKLALELISRYR